MEYIIDCDAKPRCPHGWYVKEHTKGGQLVWDKEKVKFYLSEDQKNGYGIDGYNLHKELKNQLVLNANVLDFLLEHPELIPEEWRGKTVCFWGTIYSQNCYHPDGLRSWNVRCWHFSEDPQQDDYSDWFWILPFEAMWESIEAGKVVVVYAP